MVRSPVSRGERQNRFLARRYGANAVSTTLARGASQGREPAIQPGVHRPPQRRPILARIGRQETEPDQGLDLTLPKLDRNDAQPAPPAQAQAAHAQRARGRGGFAVGHARMLPRRAVVCTAARKLRPPDNRAITRGCTGDHRRRAAISPATAA
jgi:hypothetical protein